jgi:hypothetical protein
MTDSEHIQQDNYIFQGSEIPSGNVKLVINTTDEDPELRNVLKSLYESITATIDQGMVGLNISRRLVEPFRNFHDPSPRANDFKIRRAFIGTHYWGAYMTDTIKNVEMVTSTDLRAHLKAFPALIQSNVNTLLDELRDLNATRPTILAFGSDAQELIALPRPARRVRTTHPSDALQPPNQQGKIQRRYP